MIKKIVLGGKEFEIAPANLRKSKAWRDRFATPILEKLESVGGIASIKLDDSNDLLKAIKSIGIMLLEGMDTVVDATIAYSDRLSTEKEWILDHATDQEAIDALITILGMAFPFGSILAKFQRPTGK
jgi:hypothetical protein